MLQCSDTPEKLEVEPIPEFGCKSYIYNCQQFSLAKMCS